MSNGMQRTAVVLLGLAALGAPLTAQQPGKGKGPKSKDVVVQHKGPHKFRANDRTSFQKYFRDHRIVVTPLRPEVARLVVVGRPLPPGIAKQVVARDVYVLVPPPTPRYQYVVVGNRLLLLDDRGWVADIIDGLF